MSKTSETPVKVLLADDHTIVFSGVRLILKQDLGITDVAHCQELDELISAIDKHQPSHLILDISFPDGSSINLLPEITASHPNLKILLFSMHPRPLFDNILKRYKNVDFCEKNESEASVTEHIKRFFRGEFAYKPTRKTRGLGKRETQIMDLMMKGYSTQMIAQELGLKSNTISTFKGRIFRKLNANNLVDLVRIYG